MMKDWKEIKLGEICTIKHGWAFKGEFFTKEGVKIVVTPGNFFEEGGFRLQVGKEKFYSADFPKEYLLKKDDLVIAMTEQGEGLLGSPALIPCDDRYLHNQRIGLFQDLDENIVCKKFIYYVFFTKEVRGSIASSATGTKVKHTAPKRIYSINLKLPPLETQQKIASILSAYDDLIENNLRRIKLLEEMAAITYKEWFINFTIEGEKLAIDETTGLPFGWERKRSDEIFDIKIGKTPPREQTEWFTDNEVGVKWASIRDMNNSLVYIHNTSERITNEGIKRFNMNIAKKGTVILSFKLTVGKVSITTENFVTNEAIAHFNIKDEKIINKEFTYCYLKDFNYDSLGSTSAIGTAINSKVVKAMPIQLPDNKTMMSFKVAINPILTGIENLSTQNLLLKESRDILLPRLMSGTVNLTQ